MKEIKVKPKLEFKDGKAYSVVELPKREVLINGCLYYQKQLANKLELEEEITILKEKLRDKEREMLYLNKELGELNLAGYCPIDYEQTRLKGKLETKVITHRPNCRHKE